MPLCSPALMKSKVITSVSQITWFQHTIASSGCDKKNLGEEKPNVELELSAFVKKYGVRGDV